MFKHYPLPVVIGSGLTGLLISLELSKAGVKHLLIGGPPPAGGPRLGESLNLEATIYFLTEFPELADCYYKKAFAAAYSGNITGIFDFSYVHSPEASRVFTFFGKQTPDLLIHFDRVQLDAALYEKAVSTPFCTNLDTRVSALHCTPGTDHIQQIELEDGSKMPVSYLFDATGHIRLLARHLCIPRKILGPAQYGVFTHYYRDTEVAPPHTDGKWQHGTSVLRLYEERDGFNALAWCIPMGKTISVGVTTPLTEERKAAPPADEQLLTKVKEVFALYNVNYGDVITGQSPVGRARLEFYNHASAYGANWLLASAAHTQVWWPTSSGIDTSVAAAHIAAQFIRNPQRAGARYQYYMETLSQAQTLWNWAATHSYGSIDETSVSKFADRLFQSITSRMYRSFTLEDRDFLSRLQASLSAKIFETDILFQIQGPFEVHRHNFPVPIVPRFG